MKIELDINSVSQLNDIKNAINRVISEKQDDAYRYRLGEPDEDAIKTAEKLELDALSLKNIINQLN